MLFADARLDIGVCTSIPWRMTSYEGLQNWKQESSPDIIILGARMMQLQASQMPQAAILAPTLQYPS